MGPTADPRAVAAARTAFDDGRWSNLPPNKRERIINKLADLIESHAAEFAELESIDNGKPVGMAAMANATAVRFIRVFWDKPRRERYPSMDAR